MAAQTLHKHKWQRHGKHAHKKTVHRHGKHAHKNVQRHGRRVINICMQTIALEARAHCTVSMRTGTHESDAYMCMMIEKQQAEAEGRFMSLSLATLFTLQHGNCLMCVCLLCAQRNLTANLEVEDAAHTLTHTHSLTHLNVHNNTRTHKETHIHTQLVQCVCACVHPTYREPYALTVCINRMH